MAETSLPEEMSWDSLSRLAAAATVLASALIIEQVLTLILDIAVAPQAMLFEEVVISGVGCLLSAALVLAIRRRRFDIVTTTALSLAWVVAITFVVSVGDHADIWWADGHVLHGISWACIVLVVLPGFVPAERGQLLVLLAALLAADPLGLTTAAVIFDYPMPHRDAYLSVTIPNALAAILGWVLANTLASFRREISRARQLGQYTLVDKIGEGGMGVVWRAQHAMLRRPTALKLLPAERLGPVALERFEREVQNTAALTHPNTVQIFDFGRTDEGVFYYAMEHLDGLDLQALVDEHAPLPAGRVIHILRQACGALGEAHGRELVHRDIKPSNIMLCRRGRRHDVVKVLDFGLVKEVAMGKPEGGDEVTEAGDRAVIGTPAYLSPEAIEAPSFVDHRSDLYALGAVGYALLTGTEVFNATSVVDVCYAHLHRDVEPPSRRAPNVPGDLEAVVLRCLAKARDDRYSTAEELDAALIRCVDASGWSEAQAATWWREHPQVDSVSPSQQTRHRTIAIAPRQA